MKYFGTDIRFAGHYLWDISEHGLSNSTIYYKNIIPFDPEQMPRKGKGEKMENGEFKIHREGGFTILAIEGSPADKRGNSKSLFILEGNLSDKELIEAVVTHPYARKILEAMPFKVNL